MCGKGGIYMSKSKNPRFFAILALILTIQTGVIANAHLHPYPKLVQPQFQAKLPPSAMRCTTKRVNF